MQIFFQTQLKLVIFPPENKSNEDAFRQQKSVHKMSYTEEQWGCATIVGQFE